MKYPASEFSDRIMNLNRLEERNLENRKKSIDKEQRTSMSLINHEIKRLEVEYETKQEMLKITENQEKINHLTEALNLNFLIDKNNNFLEQLDSDAFEIKSTENHPVADKNNQNISSPTSVNDNKINDEIINPNEEKETSSQTIRKNLSANGRISRQGSKLRATSAHNIKNSTKDENECNSDSNKQKSPLQNISPNVTFELNGDDHGISSTPREFSSRLSRPKSSISLNNIDKINSVSLEPTKININNNLITVQQIPTEYATKTTIKDKDKKKQVPFKEQKKRNLIKLTKRSQSQSAYIRKTSSENLLPSLYGGGMPFKPISNKSMPAQHPISHTNRPLKEDSNRKTNEIIFIKDKTNIRLNSPVKTNKNASFGYFSVPLTVKTLNFENDILKANKINSTKESIAFPLIIKK